MENNINTIYRLQSHDCYSAPDAADYIGIGTRRQGGLVPPVFGSSFWFHFIGI